MLLFSSGTFTVDGVTVFPDHADPNQFWYLPAPVALAKMPDSDEPQFLLIMYAPDVASNGIKGVGFLDVTLALKITDDAHDDIIGQIRAHFPDAADPRLTPVPFDEGTVQVVALDLQGSGGTSAGPTPDGAFRAVQRILGTVSPELFGDNNALFALTLTEDGASILEAAFDDGMAPIGAIYSLKFTGVRPALDVTITADLKRVYDSFSVDLTAQVYWVSAGIDATFEKLRQDGAIKVEVVNLTTDQENSDKENWALNLFKDQILSTWFQPSLNTSTATGADASSVGTQPAKPAGGTLGGSPGAPNAGTSGMGTPGGMGGPSLGSPGGLRPGGIGGPSIQVPGGTLGSAPGSPIMPPLNPSAPSAPTGSMSPGGSGAATGTAPALAPPVPRGGAPTLTPVPGVGGPTKPPGAGGAGGLPGAGVGLPGTAAGASNAASPIGVSLRLKFVSQDEQKTVKIEYNRMDAVQRVYAPQGFFGLMLDKIDRSKHFLKVDGTDPFFNQFKVTVNPPRDFAGLGLLSAHVAIDYGDPASSNVKHGEFLFDPAHQASLTWSIFEGLIQSTQFQFTVDYKFDSESGWQGEQIAYTLPQVTTENRVLNLDPYEILGFMQVAISPGSIDPLLVDRIEVPLQYTSKSGWQTDTTIIVRPNSPSQLWKVRLADKTDNAYTYSTTCFLKDGSSYKSDMVTSSATAIIVGDPFLGALDLTVQPALDASKTRLAVVEISYRDDTNDYSFQTSFQIAANATASIPVHIPVMDRTNLQYRYRVTTIGLDDQKNQGNYISAQDPLVLVSEAAAIAQ